MKTNLRAQASRILRQAIQHKQPLKELLSNTEPLVKAICYGVCRDYYELRATLQSLLVKPLPPKHSDIFYLLLVGLYQLSKLRIPAHAAVTETVQAAQTLKKPWAKALINHVLRQFLRQQQEPPATPAPPAAKDIEVEYNHPRWLVEAIKHSWHELWPAILQANNQQAPLSLRVNLARTTREDYLSHLNAQAMSATIHPYSPCGLILNTAVDVSELPGFAEGLVSVQDISAQLAAPLLDVEPHMRVLDACCAPGGKTGHLLELCPTLDLTAIDQSAQRLEKVSSNLQRLRYNAKLICADAANTAQWWDGKKFDRILLDAPCSALGVIRRHPDIKLQRSQQDIDAITQQQWLLLQKLWPLLAPGGKLVYATCSIMPQENYELIAKFSAQTADCHILTIEAAWGRAVAPGRQILPGEANMDGFYYAILIKREEQRQE